MISFQRREDVVPSALILLAIIILAGTLLYMLFVPPPSVAGVVAVRLAAKQQLLTQIADTKRQTQKAQAAIKTRVWRGSPDTISAAILSLVTQQARRHALKLDAFRPQRAQALTGVTELPFSVQISGTYPHVQAMMAELDAENTPLALRSIEIAATDETTDAVTATLGISAYSMTESPQAQAALPEGNAHA